MSVVKGVVVADLVFCVSVSPHKRVLWSKDLVKWNTVAEYNPARQAESYFYNLSVTLPREAFSNATRCVGI